MWMWASPARSLFAATVIAMAVAVVGVAMFVMTMHPEGRPHALCGRGDRPLPYFTDSQSRISQWSDGFATELWARHEPSLLCATAAPVYRFVWLRSFNPAIVVRIEASAGGWRISAQEDAILDMRRHRRTLRRVERPLTADEVRRFRAAIDRSRFWTAATEPVEDGLDGALWLVEARDGGRYRYREQWTPDHGIVRDVGLAFIASTGWDIPPETIY